MTLGELKIACYKLIDPSDTDLNVENISEVYETDTAYSFYFLNMLNSINQAITRLVQSFVLPLKKINIEASEIYNRTFVNGVQNLKRASINLGEYASDLYKIKVIEYIDTEGNYQKINYRLIGNFLDIDNKENGEYSIYYYPRLNTIESYNKQSKYENINDFELSDLGLNDSLVSIIPYFVKADLLEHDKPTEAVLSRNTFEQYLASFDSDDVEVHNKAKSWFGGVL